MVWRLKKRQSSLVFLLTKKINKRLLKDSSTQKNQTLNLSFCFSSQMRATLPGPLSFFILVICVFSFYQLLCVSSSSSIQLDYCSTQHLWWLPSGKKLEKWATWPRVFPFLQLRLASLHFWPGFGYSLVPSGSFFSVIQRLYYFLWEGLSSAGVECQGFLVLWHSSQLRQTLIAVFTVWDWVT